MRKCRCGCGKEISVYNRLFYSMEHYANWLSKNSDLRKRLKNKSIDEVYNKKITKKIIKSKSGKNSHFYKNGKGYRGYDGFRGSIKRKIKRMYNNVCQVCYEKINEKYLGSCHHINYNKKDNRLINLVYIHSNRRENKKKCHRKIHKNKDYYFTYFCYQKGLEPETLIT